MQENDIKENIRFFKPNDPYYYEVDNLPLIDLLNNDKILRDEINLILAADTNYASEAFVITNLQAAIGDAGEVDIDGDGITPEFTDLISWINSRGYLTEVATSIGDLLDVDTSTVSPLNGNTLIYDSTLSPPRWVPGSGSHTGEISVSQIVMYSEHAKGEQSLIYDNTDSAKLLARVNASTVSGDVTISAADKARISHFIVWGSINNNSGSTEIKVKDGSLSSFRTVLKTSGGASNAGETQTTHEMILAARPNNEDYVECELLNTNAHHNLRIRGYILTNKIKVTLNN